MKYVLILNDAPYGTERSYNGLRLAGELAKRDGEEVKLFLIGDAAACAKRGQTTPNGYYNLERMLKVAARGGSEQGVCGSCMDARGITEDELVDSAHRSTMAELTDWTIWADKVLVF
ncbi:MAG: DsrE/DsrF/TusD sulfur relay family protein [Spirochaeta sp.]